MLQNYTSAISNLSEGLRFFLLQLNKTQQLSGAYGQTFPILPPKSKLPNSLSGEHDY